MFVYLCLCVGLLVLVCCVFMYVGVYVVHVCYCSVVEWGFFHLFFFLMIICLVRTKSITKMTANVLKKKRSKCANG